jgi:hypothetical protein
MAGNWNYPTTFSGSIPEKISKVSANEFMRYMVNSTYGLM